MFLGHLAVGFASKRAAPQVSLGWFVAAPLFLDLVWPLFLATGVERVRIDPGNTAFTPLAFEHYPWSHSLLMAVVWSVAFGALSWVVTRSRPAALLVGNIDELSQSRWQRREEDLESRKRWLYRLQTEPHRRWANGFSCLGFVLIGAPMAIRRRHGEFWGSFFICFLPILLVYYPMLVGVVIQAKDGVVPPQAVWLGNVVLAAWGVWLMRRVMRF